MLARYIEIVFYRAGAELRRDASRAYLGVLWWFLEPILYMAVFYLVFGLGLRKGGPDFIVYLLTGLIVWRWLDGAVRASTGAILTSVGLMQQVYLPKILLPAVIVVMHSYKFLIVFSVFLLFLTLAWKMPVSPAWWALPVLMTIQLVLICALAGLVAGIIPIVPDFKFLVDFGMTLLFFMSGIFFDVHELTPAIQDIIRYNPMVTFIDAYRQVLLFGQAPQWDALLKILLVAVILLASVCVMLKRLDRYYPRVVG